MRSRWSIKRKVLKSGSIRFEPWLDGKYQGSFETHEKAWEAIEQKMLANPSTPENIAAKKAQVAQAKAAKASKLKSSRLARSWHPGHYGPAHRNHSSAGTAVGVKDDLETYRKLAETA